MPARPSTSWRVATCSPTTAAGRISTIDALLGYGSIQSPEPLLESGRKIVAFGQDADGEVLVVDHGGALLRLVPGE